MKSVSLEFSTWLNSVRDIIASTLLAASDKVRPRQLVPKQTATGREQSSFQLSQIASLPFGERVDWHEAREGRLVARFSAMDPIWNATTSNASGLVPLRRHMQGLGSLIIRLDQQWEGGAAIFEQLRLAYSLTEVSADTDINEDSFWCGHAADYEDVSSELAAKHLAGTIVFNLVWTAYEAAVEEASNRDLRNHPKGAAGRDLLRELFGHRPMPGLRSSLLDALELHPHDLKSIKGPEVKAALSTGCWASLAAEHLRRFRNASVHGDITLPEPEDWGRTSKYVVDQDPAIRRFGAHIRLTLLLIQALMIVAVRGRGMVLPSGKDAVERLTTLHLVGPRYDEPMLFEEASNDDDF